MARLGTGTRKRANGTLEKRFTIDGKRYSVYGKTTKELAENEQAKRNEITSGLYMNNRNITLDGYFNEWIKGKRNAAKSNTLSTYSILYKKHISSALGKRKIQQIERREVLYLQQSLLEQYSNNTINLVITILKTILNDAIKDEIIEKNPAAGISVLKKQGKASETYHRALTEEEQNIFMQEIATD